MKLPIALIVLTHDEELNLPSCLENAAPWVQEIFVVDSYSNDGTAQIAKRYGAKIVEHPFENQANQFNWALDNLEIKSDWILRLDADEYLTLELWQEIAEKLTTSDVVNVKTGVNGFYIKRRVYFMGRWIRHGGYYPTWILRLFRRGKGRSEDREMDEHIVLREGRAENLKNDFIDDNKKNLEFWLNKHNNFSSREAREAIKAEEHKNKKILRQEGGEAIEGPPALRRKAKEKYYRLPIFFRAFLYFIYRYFFRLGFLDGKEGLIFHFLQGFWYRFLVDAKLYEYRKLRMANRES